MKGIAFSLVMLLAFWGVVYAPDKKKTSDQDEQGDAVLSFVVLRDYNGKAVRNAAVVLHPLEDDGKQSKGGLELKTDADGKATLGGVPYGKLRVQVLAPGFQTFGEDYEVNQPNVEIVVKLKRPTGQYSIYEEHPGDKDKSPPPDPNAQPHQD